MRFVFKMTEKCTFQNALIGNDIFLFKYYEFKKINKTIKFLVKNPI